MATVDTLPEQTAEQADSFDYRPLSAGAVASVVLGVLSLLVFVGGRDSLALCMMLCPIPVVGLLLGWSSLRKISAPENRLSGRKVAVAGLTLSAICLVGGLGFSGYVYATEVPPGYMRTSFVEFRPDEVEERRGAPIPPDVAPLNGEKVFIKGYMRADSTPYKSNIRKFLLVRDSNECCFGDISKVKYYDQVLVELTDNLTTDYSRGIYRVGGTLTINSDNVSRGIGYPVYSLQADYVQ